MAFKFVVLAALVAVASAGVVAPLGYAAGYASPALGYASPLAYGAAPVVAKAVVPVNAEYDPNPQYHYAYSVADAITGDNKHQEETRNGDAVQGSYSLIEADGTRRVVEYTADPINGFNAVVHKEGVAVQKAVVAAPALAYAAPVAKLAYAAPVARYAAPAVAHYAAAPAYSAYAAPALHAVHAAPAFSAYHAAPAVVNTHYASPYASYVH